MVRNGMGGVFLGCVGLVRSSWWFVLLGCVGVLVVNVVVGLVVLGCGFDIGCC